MREYYMLDFRKFVVNRGFIKNVIYVGSPKLIQNAGFSVCLLDNDEPDLDASYYSWLNHPVVESIYAYGHPFCQSDLEWVEVLQQNYNADGKYRVVCAKNIPFFGLVPIIHNAKFVKAEDATLHPRAYRCFYRDVLAQKNYSDFVNDALRDTGNWIVYAPGETLDFAPAISLINDYVSVGKTWQDYHRSRKKNATKHY